MPEPADIGGINANEVRPALRVHVQGKTHMNAYTVSKTIKRCALGALLVLAVVSTSSLVGSVAPAPADSRICAKEQRGCASFKHVGNTMDVCDTAYDGASVAVQRGDRKIIAVNYWGSLKYNGCRRWHIRGRNGTTFKYRVCPAHYARRGGKPIALSKFYCSGWQPDIY